MKTDKILHEVTKKFDTALKTYTIVDEATEAITLIYKDAYYMAISMMMFNLIKVDEYIELTDSLKEAHRKYTDNRTA